MSEVYRKRGRSVRREGEHLSWVDEAGEAIEERGIFRTRALDEAVDLNAPDAEAVDAAAREIESIVEPPLTIERIHVSEGIVAHQFDGITWNETPRRVHLSIARRPIRILIDLAEFGFDGVRRATSALLRAGGEREAPKRIRLADHVGAAVLPFAVVKKSQTAAAHDGKGQPIEERICSDGPSNWFRPSYRVRPRRAWFHVRIESFGVVDDDVPEAVALLAPVGRRAIRVLCVDKRMVVPTTIPIGSILGARPMTAWYPYGAGSFGAEIML